MAPCSCQPLQQHQLITILFKGWKIPHQVLYTPFQQCPLQCDEPALLVTMPFYWQHSYANIFHHNASYPPVRFIGGFCSEKLTSPIPLLVKSHTLGHVIAWSVRIRLRQWMENTRSTSQTWLGCLSLPGLMIPKQSPIIQSTIIFYPCWLGCSCHNLWPFACLCIMRRGKFWRNWHRPLTKSLGHRLHFVTTPTYLLCSQKGSLGIRNQLMGLQDAPIPTGEIVQLQSIIG
jgi:hypothetical protein